MLDVEVGKSKFVYLFLKKSLIFLYLRFYMFPYFNLRLLEA